MRKVLKTRAQFQGDDAVVKTLWLAIVDIKEKRAEARATQATKPANERNSALRLIEGTSRSAVPLREATCCWVLGSELTEGGVQIPAECVQQYLTWASAGSDVERAWD